VIQAIGKLPSEYRFGPLRELCRRVSEVERDLEYEATHILKAAELARSEVTIAPDRLPELASMLAEFAGLLDRLAQYPSRQSEHALLTKFREFLAIATPPLRTRFSDNLINHELTHGDRKFIGLRLQGCRRRG
jgi:hypothetical protein